ncbi:MAG: 50S ribosome-binding GTPase [Phycisphaerales bacterium]|nr:50S ribosome-binding GTPase [Phycisphaerales bacterium]
MTLGDTIVAQASAPGWSARAIIRLSGPETFVALDTLASAPVARQRGGTAITCRVPLEGDVLSVPALLLRFTGPRSYTGEDAAELHVVGNPWLIEAVIESLCLLPHVRPAHPGEFSARAYLNGRLSIEQAEGVQAIIAARNDAELDAARALVSGASGAVYRTLADDLATLLALVEAGIDFVEEEDIVAISPADLHTRLATLRDALVERSGPAAAPTRQADPSVVLVGPPNAGKSTLFNQLIGRERAVVSDQPGTTRDALVERIELAADAEWRQAAAGRFPVPALALVDLAGLDQALAEATPLDQAAQQLALERIEEADLVVLCDPEARFEAAALLPHDLPRLRIRTKGDLPGDRGDSGALRVCALDGWNLAALRRAMLDGIAGSRSGTSLLVLPRHRRALVDAARRVDAALELLEPQRAQPMLDAPELIGAELRLGLDALAELAGEVTPDDVIGRIFASFCIGK